MSPSTLFDWHVHEDHQLAWASAGVLTVLTDGTTWVLPPSRALWIPAGVPHETGASGRATMRSVYVPPGMSPVTWDAPTVVAATPLLAEVIGYLSGERTATQREHAEVLLSDLLTPLPVTTLNVTFPDDPIAGSVARKLSDDPADQQTIAEWGRAVGASERTLARAFVTDDRAALRPLANAAEAPVGAAAARQRRGCQPYRRPGGLPDAERVHRRLPAGDRHDSGRVLRPELKTKARRKARKATSA